MDLTVAATPFYFGSMAVEYKVLQARAEREGPSAADYERRDTIASLSMGVGSLLAPLVWPRRLAPLAPGNGKYGKVLPLTAGGAILVTTAADFLARLDGVGGADAADDVHDSDTAVPHRDRANRPAPAVERVPWNGAEPSSRKIRRRVARAVRKVAGVGGVTAVVAGGLAVTTWWQARTSPGRKWKRRLVPAAPHANEGQTPARSSAMG